MKLAYLAICGFRGFRDPARIEFGPGFTIIIGPNGSGKSTVCDAIEFALMGHIRPGSAHTERGEHIDDYLWWRGAGSPSESYVELGLVAADGTQHRVRRSPSSGGLSDEIRRALVDERASLDDPIGQICRTAVLRDEAITALSVDLPESDRFSFVRAALGSADFTLAENKAQEVLDYLGKQKASAQRLYDGQMRTVADLTASLSALRAEAARATDLDQVEQSLRAVITSSAETLSALVHDAESALARNREKFDALGRVYSDLARLVDQYSLFATQDVEREFSTRLQVEDKERELRAAQTELADATTFFEQAQALSPRLVSLAQLREHGLRVGLVEGRCPLCGSKHTEERFTAHLRALEAQIKRDNADISARASLVSHAQARVEALDREVEPLRRQVAAQSEARSTVLSAIHEASARLVPLGVSPADDPAGTLKVVANAIDALRARTREIEASLSALRARQAANEVEEREREIEAARPRLVSAERTLSGINSAEAIVKESVDTIRRVRGEVIDEQLAALNPLLVEIYQRLRPHLDWHTVRYNLRGDVRHMLSLEVHSRREEGEESAANPSFIFSSGQRRITGLAFLLALHLSRGWCGLRTLILDDPVQHVDDYRALHLTEVLAAIRRTHRQVICTVEDGALCDLLARRLGSHGDERGAIVRLEYSAGVGAHVVERRAVASHERRILVA